MLFKRTGDYPPVDSTVFFLKYPLELQKNSVGTEKKFQLVYTEFFFQFLLNFFSVQT